MKQFEEDMARAAACMTGGLEKMEEMKKATADMLFFLAQSGLDADQIIRFIKGIDDKMVRDWWDEGGEE
jgi:hypothetical protein